MRTLRHYSIWALLALLSLVLGSTTAFRIDAPITPNVEGQTILFALSAETASPRIQGLPELRVGNANPLRTAGLKGRRIEREEWYEYMLTYPGTSIPSQARQKGYDLMRSQTSGPSLSAYNVWESVGPSPIAGANLNGISTNSAGRTTAILVHPQDSNTVYVGGAQGGVWKTTNGGSAWTPLTDSQATLSTGAMAFDPTNPNIVYVGTGEPHDSMDSYYGAGILKTTDGGSTWTQLGATQFAGMGISNIVVDPNNTSKVYAAASTNVAGRKPVSYPPGIYQSTNNGADWTLMAAACYSGGAVCVSPSALVMHPSNSNVLYAAFDQAGIYKFDGTNWTLKLGPSSSGVGFDFFRAEVAVSPANGSVLYAGLERTSSGRGYLYRSDDGGDNWTVSGLTYSYCGEQCWYDNVIAIHPTNSSIVMAGGAALYSSGIPGIDGVLFKSTDGGASWTWNSGSTAGTTLHPDLHAIAFDPSNPNNIWLGTDGGVYRSTDGGATWANRNGNMGTLQFQSVALHPTDPSTFYGGMQDNAKSKTTNGGASWLGVDVGDGGVSAIDPFDPTYWYGSRFSYSGYYMQFQRNSLGGSTAASDWPEKSSGININDRVMFYAPLAADPNNAGRVYWGTHRLYRSNDRGDNWTAISGDLTKNQNSRSAISTFDVAPGDSNVILVGTADGYVHLTTNGGTPWTNVTNSPLPNRFVSDVAIQNSQTMYVSYSGFNANTPSTPGHIFKTTNAGQTWSDVSHTGETNGLPDLPVLTIALDRDTGSIYVGTDLGVYLSSDGGSSWTPFSQGLPKIAIFDLALSSYSGGKYLVAATHGRSIWRLSLATPSPSLSANSLTFLADSTDRNPSSQNVVVSNGGSGGLTWTAREWSGGAETNLPWLSLSASAGTAPSTIAVSVDKTQVVSGTVTTGQIRVDGTSASALNTPQYVTVTLNYRSSALARVFLPAVVRSYAPSW